MTREHMTNFVAFVIEIQRQILDFNEQVLIMSLHAVKCVQLLQKRHCVFEKKMI